VVELTHDLAADGLGAENHPGDGGGHDQDRRDGKECVVGE
jgi:hypothetical protein